MANESLDDSMVFLEATHEKAAELLEFHTNRRADWTVAKLREKHDYPRLLYEVTRRKIHNEPFELPESLQVGLYITLMTENGIVWYPRDVGSIFNPLGKEPADNDPHAQFARTWTSEEFPHGQGLIDCLWLTNTDMIQYEKARTSFQAADATPRPDSTPGGVTYTGTQELSTDKPYRNLARILKETASSTDDKLVREVCEFIRDVVSHISADERMHARFINGLGKAAVESGDPRIVSMVLNGAARTVIDFAMPGDPGIPNFRRLSVRAARLGVFTPYDLAEIKVKQLDETWKVAEHNSLTPEGEQSQLLLLQHRSELINRHPALAKSAA